MFALGLFPPPRFVKRTENLLPNDAAVGVTIADLTSAIAAGHGMDFGDGDLNLPPLDAQMFGTLVRDEMGRTGIRDETMGETVLLDYYLHPDRIKQDLGKIVFVIGILTGADTPQKADGRVLRGGSG